MGKLLKFEYQDVKDFKKEFRKRTGKRNVDNMFKEIANKALENTLKEAEENTPKRGDGTLKAHWRKNVKSARKIKGEFVASATNKAYNKLAAEIMGKPERNGYYASWVEVGNVNPAPYYEDENGVHWISRPEGVHMLAKAENNTEGKLQSIVDDEIKKFFGGLFD